METKTTKTSETTGTTMVLSDTARRVPTITYLAQLY